MNEAFPTSPAELESSVERNQKQLRDIEKRARKLADNATWNEDTPHISEMSATYESSWQDGRRGQLRIDLAPVNDPMAEMVITHNEYPEKADGSDRQGGTEKRYVLAHNNDGDLMLMVSSELSIDSITQSIHQADAFIDTLSKETMTPEDVEFARIITSQVEHETEEFEQKMADSFHLASSEETADLHDILDVAVAGDRHDIHERRQQHLREMHEAEAQRKPLIKKVTRGVMRRLGILTSDEKPARSPRHRRNNR